MRQPFSLPTVLAALFVSLLAVVPFLPQAGRLGDRNYLEARVVTSTEAIFRVFYDTGGDLDLKRSVATVLSSTRYPQTLRLPLPEGRLEGLVLQPIERGGRISILNLSLRDASHRVVRRIDLHDLQPLSHIEHYELKEGAATVTVASGITDPLVRIPFGAGGLELRVSDGQRLHWWLELALPVFAALLAALWLAGVPRVRKGLERLRSALAARPVAALASVAAAATVLSAYPVAFLGRSFVSPNDGTVLLYESHPTIPGYSDAYDRDSRGTDVGAVMWQNMPYSVVQHEALLRHGEVPLWDRYNSGGVALFGQGQSMLADPLHLLLPVLFDGAAWAWDLKFLVAKFLFALGLGLGAWRLTRHLPASVLTAVSACFIGFFLYRYNHPAYFCVCYAPWILVAWLKLAEADTPDRRFRAATLLAAATLWVLAAGSVKEAYMLALFLNLAGAAALLSGGAEARRKAAGLVLAAGAGVVVVLAGAPMWMSLLDSLRHAYSSYDASGVYQIQPSLALGLFDELYYRPLVANRYFLNPSLNGLFLLGLLYFLATVRRGGHRREALGLLAASVPPAALAFGVVPGVWIRAVPFLGGINHTDNTFSCVLIVLFALLAACGFAAAWRRLGGAEGRGDAAMTLAGLALLAGAYVAFGQVVHKPAYGEDSVMTVWHWGHRLPMPLFVGVSLCALLAASALVLFLARRALLRGRWQAAGLLMAAACAGVFLWRFGLQAGDAFDDWVVHPSVRARLLAPSAAVEAVKAESKEPFRVVGLGATLFPGWTGVYGLEGIAGPDALESRPYRELADALGFERVWDWRLVVEPRALAAVKRACDFLGVRYYFGRDALRGRVGDGLVLEHREDLDVYRSDQAWPRAFFTNRISRVAGARAVAALVKDGSGRPFAAIDPSDHSVDWLRTDKPAERLVVPARHYALTGNTSSFDIEATGPGVAVLQETWEPGAFVAKVDGRIVRCLRVNHAFKGVLIETPGLHRVEFFYRPAYWHLSCGLALVGLAGWAAIGIFPWRRREHL